MGTAGRRTSPLPIFLLTEDSRQTPPDDPERRMGKGLTKAEGNSGSLAEKRKGIRWRGRDPKGFPRAGTLVRFHSRSSATGRLFSFRRHLAPYPLSLSIHSSSAHPPSLFNFIPHHPPFLPPLSLLSVPAFEHLHPPALSRPLDDRGRPRRRRATRHGRVRIGPSARHRAHDAPEQVAECAQGER